jgi:glycosyltransferase involved in cell wall biosynthesis
MKKILFITWDGPQTSYMEGLFMPIFNAVQECSDYRFHVIQFTWGSPERVAITKQKAVELGITYSSFPIIRKPNATLGSLLTLIKGVGYLKKYIREHKIAIVMPRSTMPSIMVNRLKDKNFHIVFDADGLPLEERVDFSGLSRTSKQYQFFKKEENKILLKADAVITRSKKAILVHLKTLANGNSEKFSVVFNGRDINFFKPDGSNRSAFRKQLGIPDMAKVMVYCGSLGPQYGWEEMLAVFQTVHKNNPESLFLILTGNPEFAQERIPENLTTSVILKKVPFEEVPKYLNTADVAFAIRQPKYSMQGVAPIKLGEYLLMGLPTIASAGIGDSEEIIKEIPDCFLFEHDKNDAVSKAVAFVENLSDINHERIRNYGVEFFSLEKSALSYKKAFDKL